MEQIPDRNIWDRVLGKIEARVNAHSFKTWFRPTHLVSEDGASLRVRVPNSWFAEWLQTNYLPVIQDVLREIERPGAFGRIRPRPRRRAGAVARRRRTRESSRGSSQPAAERPVPTRIPCGVVEPRYTFDKIRRFVVQPVRARCGDRRRGTAVACLQPAATSTAAWGWARRT